MDFKDDLDEGLSKCAALSTVTCGNRVAQKMQSGTFCGYMLKGCLTAKCEQIAAGFVVNDCGKLTAICCMTIHAVYTRDFKMNLTSAQLSYAITDLISMLLCDCQAVPEDIAKLEMLTRGSPVINSAKCVLKRANGSMFILNDVKVNFDFGEKTYALVFGKRDAMMAASLTEMLTVKGTKTEIVLLPKYETLFEKVEDGNIFYKKIASNKRVENKMIFYNLDKNIIFDKFYRIDGVSLKVGVK